MLLAYPATSPTFVTTILYSTITVEPFICFASNSILAVFVLLYSLTVVPAEFCTTILLTYLSNFKSKFCNSIKPILMSETFESVILIISVDATCCLSSPIYNSFRLTSAFSVSLTPSALYFVKAY